LCDADTDTSDLRSSYLRVTAAKGDIPRPGEVDLVCGGPPCQGASGLNGHRATADPFADAKNMQLPLFMEIVQFLRPRWVLIENVSDILRFQKAIYGRFAINLLVQAGYQARVGLLRAGSYGVPQYRLRVFIWAAVLGSPLPSFPLRAPLIHASIHFLSLCKGCICVPRVL
jgi:DNA (cytosine-5)-methyltransferase 1